MTTNLEAWEAPHYHPVIDDGVVEWETAYSSEPPAKQVSALRLTPPGEAWNSAAAGKTRYCETDCRDRLTDLSVDQPPDGEIPRTRHPNDWREL